MKALNFDSDDQLWYVPYKKNGKIMIIQVSDELEYYR